MTTITSNGLPHDEVAEMSALGCVLIARDQSDNLLDQLSLGLFHDIRANEIFRALQFLKLDRKPLDCPTLYEHLKQKRLVENAGGFDFVSRLPDTVASASEFPVYLETLKDRAIRREAWHVG